MEKNEKKCKRCGGHGFIEIFQPELGFEVLISCPVCDEEIEKSLREILNS